MTPEQAAQLRVPFPAEQIGKLPKAGLELDFVGHAAVTDRLLQVDPEWTWEPLGVDGHGAPLVKVDGNEAVMWIRLTVAGVTRPAVGIVSATAGDREKQLISDALRNGAMRFGVALDLWSKQDLDATGRDRGPTPDEAAVARGYRDAEDEANHHDEVRALCREVDDENRQTVLKAMWKRQPKLMPKAELDKIREAAGA